MKAPPPKLVIIPTIDVEGTHGEHPFQQLVLGEIGSDQAWGVAKISQILREYDAVGTFFVDVFEHTLWGMDPWEKICRELAALGQDVQLHTHPGWRDDPRDSDRLRSLKQTKSYLSQEKDMMAKLSLAEQVEVLQHGRGLLKTWLGTPPIAHRSGGYAVNEDTIEALQKSGFKIDSSQNRAHRNSQLAWSYNSPVMKNDVLEIPVTLYDRCFCRFLPRIKGTYRRLKTSELSLRSELTGFGEHALQTGLPIINLFLHSYSLLSINRSFTRIKANPEKARLLQDILLWGKEHPQVEIMSISQYFESNLWQQHLSPGSPDSVPGFFHPGQLVADLSRKIKYSLG